MCLGIPMRIIEIDGHNARCDAGGVERDVNLFMLQEEEVKVDDLVIVHVGYAIQKVSEQEAQTSWQLYDELLRAEAESETEVPDA